MRRVRPGKYPKSTLKVEREGGVQVIRCRKEDLDYESGNALCICIPDFRGQAGDPDRNVIYIEWYDGKLQVRVYDGGEDPVGTYTNRAGVHMVKPDPDLTQAVYCPKTDLPKLLNSEDEDVKEIVEKRLKGEQI
jgi:hypothetical protein